MDRYNFDRPSPYPPTEGISGAPQPPDTSPVIVPPGVEYDTGPQPGELKEDGAYSQFLAPASDATGSELPTAEGHTQEPVTQGHDDSSYEGSEPIDRPDIAVSDENVEAAHDRGETTELSAADKLRDNLGTISKDDVVDYLASVWGDESVEMARQLGENANGAFVDGRPAVVLMPVVYNESEFSNGVSVVKEHVRETNIQDVCGVMAGINGPSGDVAVESALAQRRGEHEQSMEAHPDVAASHYEAHYPKGTPIGAIKAEQVETLVGHLARMSDGDTIPNVLLIGVDADVRELPPGTIDHIIQEFADAPEPNKLYGFGKIAHARDGKNMDAVVAWEDLKSAGQNVTSEQCWGMTLRAWIEGGGIDKMRAVSEVGIFASTAIDQRDGRWFTTNAVAKMSPRRLYENLAKGELPNYGSLHSDQTSHREGVADLSPVEVADALNKVVPVALAKIAIGRFDRAYESGLGTAEAVGAAKDWLNSMGRLALMLMGGPDHAVDTAASLLDDAARRKPLRITIDNV